nr:ASYY [Urechis unicinctus]
MEAMFGLRQAALCILAITLVCLSQCVESKFFDDSSFEDRSKRNYIDPACRRCLFDSDDWWSCNSCYAHPGGLIPYFGYSKRSQPKTESDEEAFVSAETEKSQRGVTKRAAFLTCLCCTSLASQECCERCSLASYYGKRNEKRSYETSFVDLGDYGVGGSCSCCNRDPYNFSCCSLHCTKRRRK